MLKYLFRGRSLDDNRFVTGDLVVDTQCGTMAVRRGATAVAVDPETVGLCTGLVDSSGADIFEGDILKDADGFNVAVLRDQDSPAFVGISEHAWSRGKYHLCSSPRYLAANCKGMTIVGNVYDNPEMMVPADSALVKHTVKR